MDGKPLANRNWTLAGALWDAYGYWGAKGNYWVYDVPFLTAGANCQWVEPAGKNGKSCDGQYYGVLDFQTDFDDMRFMPIAPIEVVRQDSNGGEIGRWTVADGATATMFGGMRHFAARPGGRYELHFPGKPLPKRFAMAVNNAYRGGDYMIFGVSFDGAVTAGGYTLSGYEYSREKVNASWFNSPAEMQKYVRTFLPASSLAEVVASSGDRIWQDRANNMVWVRIQGGMAYPGESKLVPNSDEDLYRTLSLVLTSK